MSVKKMVAVVEGDVITLDLNGPPAARLQAFNAAVMTYAAVNQQIAAQAAAAKAAAESAQQQEDEQKTDTA